MVNTKSVFSFKFDVDN